MPLLPAPFYDQPFFDRVLPHQERARQNDEPSVFLFGDNLEKWGKGGQAKLLRDHPQGLGIATKISPRQGLDEVIWPEWRETFEESWKKSFALARTALQRGADVWWPVDGIGTGLASLPRDCPSGWQALCAHTRALFALDRELSIQRGASTDSSHWLAIIVCGGRDYHDEQAVRLTLDTIRNNRHLVRVIEGDARGADRLAGQWAKRHRESIGHKAFPANWDRDGRKRAGPIRNSRMRDDLLQMREQTGCRIGVVAFPGGTGTANMVDQADDAGIKVLKATDILEKLDPARYGRPVAFRHNESPPISRTGPARSDLDGDFSPP